MYQKNPLLFEMSTRQLIKKRKLYTPEQWRSMMERLQKIGKNPEASITGLHSADEYGRRMIAGQKLRGQKLANKYGRKLTVSKDLQVDGNGSTRISPGSNNDYIQYSKNPLGKRELSSIIKRKLTPSSDTGKTELPRRQIQKYVKTVTSPNISKPLAQAETLAHEMDEYSLGHSIAKKLNLRASKHDDFNDVDRFIQSKRSSHNPGVLDREAKRRHKLSTLYGRDSFVMYPRDKEQFAKNKKKYVLNHSAMQDVLSQSSDPNIAEKAKKRMILDLAKKRGFHKLSLKQAEDELARLYDKKALSQSAKLAAEKRGIKHLIPDPEYDPNEIASGLFKSSRIPEGYMTNPEYTKFRDMMKDKWNSRAIDLQKYIDYLKS